MKKENKKMAQQRRAEERRKAANRKKAANILGFWVPLVLIIAVVIILIWSIATSGVSSSDTAADTEIATESVITTETASTDDEEFSTDTSLAAEDGDTVNIDFVGYLDGEAFDNGAGEDYKLELGSDTFIDGFEDQIVGHNVGETFDVNVTFPETYAVESLAGQDAVFSVTLNGIYE